MARPPRPAASADARRVEIHPRRRRSLLYALVLAPMVAFGWVWLVSGAAWQSNPLAAVGLLLGLPLVTAAGVALVRQVVRPAPMLVIERAGVTIGGQLAAVRWIPAELIRDVRPIEGKVGFAHLSWLEVIPTDRARLVAQARWPRRLLLLLEGGRVQIPTSNLTRQPAEIEALVREIVIAPRGDEPS